MKTKTVSTVDFNKKDVTLALIDYIKKNKMDITGEISITLNGMPIDSVFFNINNEFDNNDQEELNR